MLLEVNAPAIGGVIAIYFSMFYAVIKLLEFLVKWWQDIRAEKLRDKEEEEQEAEKQSNGPTTFINNLMARLDALEKRETIRENDHRDEISQLREDHAEDLRSVNDALRRSRAEVADCEILIRGLRTEVESLKKENSEQQKRINHLEAERIGYTSL